MKNLSMVAVLAIGAMLAQTAEAGFIFTSQASTNVDADGVSYDFKIDQDFDANPLSYRATLSNTSPTQAPEPLIDALVMGVNPDAVLGTDINFNVVSPDWAFSNVAGGIQFDFLGLRDAPGDRLGLGDVLTFDIVFGSPYHAANAGPDGFDMFLTESTFNGTGVGGGQTVGQVAVSFQQIGPGGEDSELLASNWGPVQINVDPMVPEPSTAAIFAIGLCGLCLTRRKR